MKTLLVMALALVSSAAFARTDTTNLTCRDAAGLVAQQGAIVLSTGKPYLYGRFVANQGFCGGGEMAVTAYVTTLDNDSCKIGYVCQAAEEGGNSISKKFPSAISSCKEGTYGSARADNYYPQYQANDHVPNITVVCKAGKWVPASNPSWKAPVTKGGLTCREGAVDYYPALDQGHILPGTIVRVCQGGKWVRK